MPPRADSHRSRLPPASAARRKSSAPSDAPARPKPSPVPKTRQTQPRARRNRLPVPVCIRGTATASSSPPRAQSTPWSPSLPQNSTYPRAPPAAAAKARHPVQAAAKPMATGCILPQSSRPLNTSAPPKKKVNRTDSRTPGRSIHCSPRRLTRSSTVSAVICDPSLSSVINAFYHWESRDAVASGLCQKVPDYPPLHMPMRARSLPIFSASVRSMTAKTGSYSPCLDRV